MAHLFYYQYTFTAGKTSWNPCPPPYYKDIAEDGAPGGTRGNTGEHGDGSIVWLARQARHWYGSLVFPSVLRYASETLEPSPCFFPVFFRVFSEPSPCFFSRVFVFLWSTPWSTLQSTFMENALRYPESILSILCDLAQRQALIHGLLVELEVLDTGTRPGEIKLHGVLDQPEPLLGLLPV